MKTLFVTLFLPLAFLCADQRLPPEDLRFEWSELKEIQLERLEIIDFHGWDSPFDGGSKVFFLEATEGRFDIMVANPNYWTDQDKEENQQVFYLITDENRFYLIEPGSEEERILSTALLKASKTLQGKEREDPVLLMKLSRLLQNREPIFTTKG